MKLSLTILVLFVAVVLGTKVFGQSNFDYEFSLVPVSVEDLPGLHSYAFAQHGEKWLIVGGRKD